VTISASRRSETWPTTANWDSQRSRPRFQGLLLSIAGLALLPATAATLMRVIPTSDDPTARLAAFIPYGLLGYLIALGCLLVVLVRARRRLLLTVITVGVRGPDLSVTWCGWHHYSSKIIEWPLLRRSS
jgi:hypothetical protein